MSIKKSLLEQKLHYRLAEVFSLGLPLLVLTVLFFLVKDNLPKILKEHPIYIIYTLIAVFLYYLVLKIVRQVVLYIVFGGVEDDTKEIEAKPVSSVSPEVKPASSGLQIIPLVIIIIIGIAIFALFQEGTIKFPEINFNAEQFDTTESHTYGTTCTNSDGIAGLYGTSGDCLTCSEGNAITNPINDNCSNGIAGVYCCSAANNDNNDNGDNGNNGTTGCIPTGCGNLWSCSGSYYIDNQEIRVNGACFPNGMRPGDIYSGWSGTCRQCP